MLKQLRDPQKGIIMNPSRIISEYKKQNLNAFEQYLPNLECVNAKEINQLWMKKNTCTYKTGTNSYCRWCRSSAWGVWID